MASTENTDAIVVGARCAGAATAMLLSRLGHRVVVLEKARFPQDTLSTHGIARGGVVQLARWGLLPDVLGSGAPAVRQVSFHTDADTVTRTFKARAGIDLLVAPRRYILDTILADAAADAGSDVRFGVSVDGVRRNGRRVTGVSGRDADGRLFDLSAKIVIGADGLRSTIGRAVHSATLVSRPRESAIFYGYFTDIDATGYEFHLGHRAMAGVFPTHDEQACVWICLPTLSSAVIRAAGASRRDALIDAIGAVSPQLSGRLRHGSMVSGVRGTIGLPNQIRQAAGPGWALVGDAGYHRDPITGHGITDAFRDAELLARSVNNQLLDGADPIEPHDYQQQRDRLLCNVFDLTTELARYPDIDRFVELQKQLGVAIDAESDWLAAQPELCPVAVG